MKKIRLVVTTVLLALAVIFTATPTIYAAPSIDGILTDSDYYLIDDNTGGPTPGFGAGHEINALYTYIDGNNFYIGIAGNVQDGNRILLFIDSVSSNGYNDGNFGRDSAPQGIDDFNSGTTFDTGFSPDYALVIGTNASHDNFFWDLYTLSGTVGSGGGPTSYLGDISDPDLAASPVNGSTTQGFEMRLEIGTDLTVNQNIQLFAAYISDGGFLSNQFITPAGSSDVNYASGPIAFEFASPNPVTINSTTAVSLQSLTSTTNSPNTAVFVGGLLLLSAISLLVLRRRQA